MPIVGLVTDVDRRAGAPAFQVHSTPNASVLRPICKAVLEIRHQAQVPFVIHDAFRIARSGEPGPVAVVLPFHFLTEVWEYDGVAPPPLPAPFDESAYRRAIGVLADRRARVGIYAGMGCLDVGSALACAAEILQAPVATSVSGKGAIPDQHPLAVGWGYGAQGTRAAEKAFKEVDVVLAVGCEVQRELDGEHIRSPSTDTVIHVDANPNNIGRNVPACVGVNADARVFFDRLVREASAIRRPADPSLVKRIARYREADRRANAKVEITEGVDPMAFLLQLRGQLGPDELIFVDVTALDALGVRGDRAGGPPAVLHPGEQPEHGLGDPRGDRGPEGPARPRGRVDLGRRLLPDVGPGDVDRPPGRGLPVKFFVLDDGAYHYMQMLQEPTFRRTTATELARVDYAAFARLDGPGLSRDLPERRVAPTASPGRSATRGRP